MAEWLGRWTTYRWLLDAGNIQKTCRSQIYSLKEDVDIMTDVSGFPFIDAGRHTLLINYIFYSSHFEESLSFINIVCCATSIKGTPETYVIIV